MSKTPHGYRTTAALAPRRNTTGSDGLFVALAIGALLLVSLLMPRTPREPITDQRIQPTELAATAIATLD